MLLGVRRRARPRSREVRGIVATSDEGKRDGFNVIRVLCREACECGAVECTVRMALATE